MKHFENTFSQRALEQKNKTLLIYCRVIVAKQFHVYCRCNTTVLISKSAEAKCIKKDLFNRVKCRKDHMLAGTNTFDNRS